MPECILDRFKIPLDKVEFAGRPVSKLEKPDLLLAVQDALSLLLEERENHRKTSQLLDLALTLRFRVEFEGEDQRTVAVTV